ADQHDEAYVEENYSEELGVTVLENGEREVGLEELSNVVLEDEEGREVEMNEGYEVPEYAVRDGQELTIKADIDGEPYRETVTVSKELPGEYIVDATLIEEGETVHQTDWNTPYQFDNHIVERQAFLDQRAERREELAAYEILTGSDSEEINRFYQERLDEGDNKIELAEKMLFNLNAAIRGIGPYEGSSASPDAFNMEKAMRDHFDYRPVFVGGFTNPKEPYVPTAGDKDGSPVDSQVAYVDGDWFHVGKENPGAEDINEIDEIIMAEDRSPASYSAVSVLAEFEEDNTDIENPENADNYVESAVLSPVYAGDKPSTLEDTYAGELEVGDNIAWEALSSIRENESWRDTMNPLELAAAVANETDITDVVTASNEQGGLQIEVEKGE
ncbi:MAG: hypothetical protein V5A72_02025, partial [Candidatus Nanohaloarchaea archaeon]